MIKNILLLILFGTGILGIVLFYKFYKTPTLSFDSVKREKPIKHLVIHSFALTPQEMLDTLKQYKLSVHYLIDSKGKVYQLVPEERVAWHAGPSFWAGDTGLNWTSIGIELEHQEFGQTDFPEAQINALIKLAQDIIKLVLKI